MTRYLLDTNIVSFATRPEPPATLIAWLDQQESDHLFISALMLAEIWRGVFLLPPGRRRTSLETWFVSADGPGSAFAGRILPFDDFAAMIWAGLMAEGSLAGRPRSTFDTMIAAIAQANRCVVTDNTRDFPGIEIFNPMRQE